MSTYFAKKHYPHWLAIIGAVVFANSFFGVFVLDEYSSIDSNEGIKHLWPPDCILTTPNDTRPVIGLSLAINYAIHGTHFWSYHVFNLIIHLVASLALYGIVRRTFLSGPLRERFGANSARLAFFIALIWMVHPLQTASVTYIIQRCESMMGMFFLLTLYCAIRSADPPPLFPDGTLHATRSNRWKAAAILFSFLGMGCKQVMVGCPLLVLLYDRTFLSGSLRDAFKQRAGLYAGLLASCAVLITTAVTNPPGGMSAGFTLKGVPPLHYLLTQCTAIPHYLNLALWPDVLSLDYSWPLATSVREVLPGLLSLSALVLLYFYGTFKNEPWGYLGAWFFIILAPTSSIMPIQDPVFEHRMYLPLAALCVGFVLGVDMAIRHFSKTDAQMTRRFCAWAFGIAAFALSVRTIVRNDDYRLQSKIWGKVVALYPTPRSTNNYGNGLAVEGHHAESIPWFKKALRLKPDYADAAYNIGVEYNEVAKLDEKAGRESLAYDHREEALGYYWQCLELDPNYPRAHLYMANILRDLHRDQDSISHYESELMRDEKCADAYNGLAAAYAANGETDAAIEHYSRVLELDAKYAKAHFHIAELLAELDRIPEARSHYEAELRLDPKDADAKTKLSMLPAPTKLKETALP